MKILVTGASGFLGRHLVPRLKTRDQQDRIIAVSSRDADLTDPAAALELVKSVKPEMIIHLAALSGGIGANKERPADFYHVNSLLVTNMYAAAAAAGVDRMIYTMGGCAYPADAQSPIGEEQLFQGIPQGESAAYSMAKAMGVVAAKAYKTQHGIDTTVFIPGNMYGEFDNFRVSESHVIPAMVRRYVEARRDGVEKVVMWGSGKPTRDFVYAGDVAECIAKLASARDLTGPINLSTESSTSIAELAGLVADAVGYEGEIVWDTEKPDGQMNKIFDAQKMRDLGVSCPTDLKTGLARTVAWFDAHYDDASDGLRL